MFHESNHYLQSLVDPAFWIPHFPGESLAEYYGASSWDPVKKKLTVGLIQEERLCEIQSDIDAGEGMDLVRLRLDRGSVRALHVGLVARALPDERPQAAGEVPEVLHGTRTRRRSRASRSEDERGRSPRPTS
jgi:hypothetical protein